MEGVSEIPPRAKLLDDGAQLVTIPFHQLARNYVEARLGGIAERSCSLVKKRGELSGEGSWRISELIIGVEDDADLRRVRKHESDLGISRELKHFRPFSVRTERTTERRYEPEFTNRPSVLDSFSDECIKSLLVVHDIIAAAASGPDSDNATVE